MGYFMLAKGFWSWFSGWGPGNMHRAQCWMPPYSWRFCVYEWLSPMNPGDPGCVGCRDCPPDEAFLNSE